MFIRKFEMIHIFYVSLITTVAACLVMLTLLPPQQAAYGRATNHTLDGVAYFKELASIETTTTTSTPIETTTTTTMKPTIVSSPPQPTTSDWTTQCLTWMVAAGIPPTEQDTAIALIDLESDCGPTAQNPKSTAYGIGQFLDSTWKGVGCVKTSEPIEQLRCMALYVIRHGGWQGALRFRINNGWY